MAPGPQTRRKEHRQAGAGQATRSARVPASPRPRGQDEAFFTQAWAQHCVSPHERSRHAARGPDAPSAFLFPERVFCLCCSARAVLKTHLVPHSLEAGRPRSRCGQGWFLPRPPYLAWRCHLLPVSSRGCPSVCVCVLISSSYKDIGPVELGPILVTSF